MLYILVSGCLSIIRIGMVARREEWERVFFKKKIARGNCGATVKGCKHATSASMEVVVKWICLNFVLLASNGSVTSQTDHFRQN